MITPSSEKKELKVGKKRLKVIKQVALDYFLDLDDKPRPVEVSRSHEKSRG